MAGEELEVVELKAILIDALTIKAVFHCEHQSSMLLRCSVDEAWVVVVVVWKKGEEKRMVVDGEWRMNKG